MNKIILMISLLLLSVLNTFAQQNLQNENWILTSNSGINFKNNSPTAFSSATVPQSNYASVSDICGNLLFITDGWNAYKYIDGNFEIIDGFHNDGNGNGYYNWIYDSIIIPRPNHPNSYYIITSTMMGLFYSIINCDDWSIQYLDMPLSDINNNFLLPSLALTSTIHSNGTDYWLLSLDSYNGLLSYYVGENGIGNGNQQANYETFSNGYGQSPYPLQSYHYNIKVAPDNNTIAITKTSYGYSNISFLDLATFNNTSGDVNEYYELDYPSNNNAFIVNGVEFSPDSNILYFSTLEGNLYKSILTDSDASSLEQIPIENLSSNTMLGNLQIAFDGKIYGGMFNSNSFSQPKLLRIDQPDNTFSSISTFDLQQGIINYLRLPQWVNSQPNVGFDSSSCITSPLFNKIAPVCNGIIFTLPTTSINGITGTWSPAINNTSTTNYIFTPDSNQLANQATTTVEINQPITPTFDDFGKISNGSISFQFPITSKEGITGTWNPSTLLEGENDYTFTPTSGQCALPSTISILLLKLKTIQANDDSFTLVPSTTSITPSVLNNDVINGNAVNVSFISLEGNNLPSESDFSTVTLGAHYADFLSSDGKYYMNSTFFPNGIYYLTYAITQNNCSDNNVTAVATITYGSQSYAKMSKPLQINDKIVVYPNPSNGVFNIDLTNIEENYDNIKIYNLLGTMIYEGNLFKSLNQIDLTSLADGYYIAQLHSIAGNIQIKLIKN